MKTCNFCGANNFDCDTECYKCKRSFSEDVIGEISQIKKFAKIILLVTIMIQAVAIITLAIFWIIALLVPELSYAAIVFAISLMVLIPGIAISCAMSNHYRSKVDAGEDVGLFFKIYTLLFVSVIAGVAMLYDN